MKIKCQCIEFITLKSFNTSKLMCAINNFIVRVIAFRVRAKVKVRHEPKANVVKLARTVIANYTIVINATLSTTTKRIRFNIK